MLRKKAKKRPDDAAQTSLKKEMAKPRMAKSARIAERNLNLTRTADEPSTTMSGIVDKIIPQRAIRPEEAKITVDAADRQHRDLQIENSLTDENGDDVKLKKGAHVEVTIAAERQTRTATTDEDS